MFKDETLKRRSLKNRFKQNPDAGCLMEEEEIIRQKYKCFYKLTIMCQDGFLYVE